MLYNFLLFYLIVISVVAVLVTIYDKFAAIRGKWRISERTLFVVSALGGGVAMLATMLLVRHKTRKLSFTIGIPAIIVLQLVATVFVLVNI